MKGQVHIRYPDYTRISDQISNSHAQYVFRFSQFHNIPLLSILTLPKKHHFSLHFSITTSCNYLWIRIQTIPETDIITCIIGLVYWFFFFISFAIRVDRTFSPSYQSFWTTVPNALTDTCRLLSSPKPTYPYSGSIPGLVYSTTCHPTDKFSLNFCLPTKANRNKIK